MDQRIPRSLMTCRWSLESTPSSLLPRRGTGYPNRAGYPQPEAAVSLTCSAGLRLSELSFPFVALIAWLTSSRRGTGRPTAAPCSDSGSPSRHLARPLASRACRPVRAQGPPFSVGPARSQTSALPTDVATAAPIFCEPVARPLRCSCLRSSCLPAALTPCPCCPRPCPDSPCLAHVSGGAPATRAAAPARGPGPLADPARRGTSRPLLSACLAPGSLPPCPSGGALGARIPAPCVGLGPILVCPTDRTPL